MRWIDNNLWDPSYFATAQDYASSFVTNLTDFDNRFKVKELLDYYNYTAAAANITRFNLSTTQGYNHIEDIYNDMFTSVSVFLFDNFDVEAPTDASTSTEEATLNALFDVFVTVFLYYLIAAGCLLIVLAVLYWFGKTHKSRWEYASIAVRTAVGVGLSLVSISYLYNTGLKLFVSPWMIPMVVIIYFIGKTLLA